MNPRPSCLTLETLRLTLQKLELDPAQDSAAIADLKRILLSRIAALEAVEALAPIEDETIKALEPAALIPTQPIAEENSQKTVNGLLLVPGQTEK